MAKEIERKFLVNLAEWKPGSSGVFYRQGYLFTSEKLTVRVRISEEEAILSIKGEDVGFQRNEYEYSIPVQDAEEMLELYCEGFIIEKTRYIELINGKRWEIDVFHGENEGLVLAEIELESMNEEIEIPRWVKEEVTGIASYYNANLFKNPYKKW